MKRYSCKKLFLFIGAIIFIIICTVFSYNSYVSKTINNSTLNLLSENTSESINDLKKDIQNRIEFLRALNKFSSADEFGSKKYFSDIEFFDTSDLSNEIYYNQLIKDKIYISEPFIQNNVKKIFIAVYKKDYVVRGIFNANDLKHVFHSKNFSANVSTYITQSNGQIIFSSADDISDNLFAIYTESEFKNDDDFYNMITNLENNLGGFAECNYDYEDKIVNYEPLGINNWYIFCSIPKKVAIEQIDNVVRAATYLLFVILSSIVLLIFYIIIVDNKRIREISSINQKLEVVTENIPGCVQTRLNDNDFTLSYLSYGFLKITGYDRDEFLNFFDNKYIALIYFEDIPLVKKSIAKQLNVDRHFKMEYRIVKKNGQIIWITERGQLINNLVYSVIIDITELKKIWDGLKISEQRYKLISEDVDDVVFEFNIKSGAAYSSENFKKIFGFDVHIQNFPQSLIDQDLIYNEDIQILLDLMNNLKIGQSDLENEFRIINRNGELIWCRLVVKLILDENKRPLKAIGKIRNINDWKIEQENLKQRAQIDLLTGLYNKITTQKLIDEYIEGEGSKNTSAIFAIDIDNFKDVNDTLGHLAGDKVLIDIANKLKKLFRQSDIIGRFGGDEFVVFIKNISSKQFAQKKANDVLNTVRSTIDNNKKCKISSSIGVAIYPKDGLNFQQLYKNADEALYQTKKLGKDSFKLF